MFGVNMLGNNIPIAFLVTMRCLIQKSKKHSKVLKSIMNFTSLMLYMEKKSRYNCAIANSCMLVYKKKKYKHLLSNWNTHFHINCLMNICVQEKEVRLVHLWESRFWNLDHYFEDCRMVFCVWKKNWLYMDKELVNHLGSNNCFR